MMIDFKAIVCHFWPKAMCTIYEWNQEENDKKGITAIRDKNLVTRQADLCKWLQDYAVFQGLTKSQRN